MSTFCFHSYSIYARKTTNQTIFRLTKKKEEKIYQLMVFAHSIFIFFFTHNEEAKVKCSTCKEEEDKKKGTRNLLKRMYNLHMTYTVCCNQVQKCEYKNILLGSSHSLKGSKRGNSNENVKCGTYKHNLCVRKHETYHGT